MQAVVFIGIQGAGKSTFFRERFFDTHVRINLDMLRTRRREALLLAACIEGKQPFVVDNTNPARDDRSRYIEPARAAGFAVVGYFFRVDVEASRARVEAREEGRRVPIRGLLGTLQRLERPTLDEGFDELWHVRAHGGLFGVSRA